MKTQNLTPKEKQQRKFLLFVPILVLPFLTLLFWALGGGQDSAAKAQGQQKGLNTKVPDASLKVEDKQNKMSYYDKASADSAKLREQMKNDPYYRDSIVGDTDLHFPRNSQTGAMDIGHTLPDVSVSGNDREASEKKVYEKLAQLQSVMNEKDKPQKFQEQKDNAIIPVTPDDENKEDPELKQMNGLLEKILDIQHPERLAVKRNDESAALLLSFRAIPAEVYEDQKIVQGSVVGLRFLDSVTINGQFIPKGQLIFGAGRLANQRLHLDLKNLKIGYRIIPVKFTAYDMKDGLEGIDVPEAITEDALRTGAVNGVGSVDVMTMDPSWNAQLAGAGVNMAKGLFSRKVKRVKARIKKGHAVLIKVDTP